MSWTGDAPQVADKKQKEQDIDQASSSSLFVNIFVSIVFVGLFTGCP